MKKIFLLLLTFVFVISCSSTQNVKNIRGVEWKLIKVHTDNADISFDRDMLSAESASEIFTLNFDAQNISGMGAPNRYSAPYSLGRGQSISISVIRSTLMASLWQPERLREHDFFVYMQNAYEWRLSNNNTLELTSKDENGDKVTLVFSL